MDCDGVLNVPAAVVEKPTERNLDWHLNHCNEPDPLMNGAPFCENTPFISAVRSDNESRG